MEKILHIIEALVNNIAGSNGLRLLKELMYKENISEVKLAEDLKMGVNEVRSLLYKLHAYNLVYSTRKKDKEKGWYIYYWTFNFNHARDLLIIKTNKKLKKLREELDRRKNIQVYECKNKCLELSLDEAMGHGFKCPECEQLLLHKDNTLYLEKLEKEIKKHEENLEILKQPIKVTIKKEVEKVKRKPRRVKKVRRPKRKIKKKKRVKKKKLKRKPKKVKKKIRRKKAKPKKLKRIKRPKKKAVKKKKVVKKKLKRKPKKIKKVIPKKIRKRSIPKKIRKRSIPKKIRKRSIPKKVKGVKRSKKKEVKKKGLFNKLKRKVGF